MIKRCDRQQLLRVASLASLLVLVVCPPAWVTADQGPIDEYQVKAAFLLNFVRFVDWPPAVFEAPAAPIIIGIVGDDPFGDQIDRLVAHKFVNGHSLQVQRSHDLKSMGKCHVLFIAGTDRQVAAKVIEAFRKSPVMTVGEMEGFAQAGGVCNFTREGARVAFEINVTAAARAGLVLSSRLLSLARIVREDGEPATSH